VTPEIATDDEPTLIDEWFHQLPEELRAPFELTATGRRAAARPEAQAQQSLHRASDETGRADALEKQIAAKS